MKLIYQVKIKRGEEESHLFCVLIKVLRIGGNSNRLFTLIESVRSLADAKMSETFSNSRRKSINSSPVRVSFPKVLLHNRRKLLQTAAYNARGFLRKHEFVELMVFNCFATF